MSKLSDLTMTDDIQEAGDSVGGKFDPVNSGLYKLKIVSAYLMESTNGASGVALDFETEDGQSIQETIYITSGKAKGQKHYYIDKKGDKQYLPGFNQINALSLLTAGKNINKLETEEKIIDVYDFNAKARLPTKVDMLMALVDKPVLAGIFKKIVDKRVLDPETSKYVPTGETRTINEVDKFFRASDQLTVTEIKAGATEAVFINTWHSKNTGVTKDESTKNVSPQAVTATPKASALFT